MSVNFLDMANGVARLVRPKYLPYVPLAAMDTPFTASGLDSLELLMCNVYIGEIYGVPEEVGKNLPPPANAQEMLDGITPHVTRQPESIEKALEQVR